MFLIIEVSSDKRAAYVLWAVDRTLPGRIAGAPVVAEECERAGRSWNWALVTLRIDSPASPAVPAQFTRMSMRPNSFMHVSISASATDGSDGEPAYPTPEIRCAAAIHSVRATTVDHDAGAFCSKQFGHRQPDAAGPADDNCRAAGQRFANRLRPPARRASSCPCSRSRACWSAGRCRRPCR